MNAGGKTPGPPWYGSGNFPDRDRLATKADLYTVALAIIAIHSGVSFALPKLILP